MTKWREETLAEGVRLICGDCREVLPTLGRFDAVVTDPPYGVGYVHGGGGNGKHSRRNVAPIIGDDSPFNPVAWLDFPEVVLWGANHYANRLPPGRWLIWNKLDGLASYDTFSDVEIAWCKRPGADRIYSLLWKGICQAKENDPNRYHPSQKPIDLMHWCMEFVDGESILDPFMGSGTTGVAAVRLGRKFTGIEIEPKYFDIACRRISDALKQPDFFIEKPKPLKQEAML